MSLPDLLITSNEKTFLFSFLFLNQGLSFPSEATSPSIFTANTAAFSTGVLKTGVITGNSLIYQWLLSIIPLSFDSRVCSRTATKEHSSSLCDAKAESVADRNTLARPKNTSVSDIKEHQNGRDKLNGMTWERSSDIKVSVPRSAAACDCPPDKHRACSLSDHWSFHLQPDWKEDNRRVYLFRRLRTRVVLRLQQLMPVNVFLKLNQSSVWVISVRTAMASE